MVMKMNKLVERLPGIIILVHALFLTSSITNEWQHSPFDAGGHVAFAIWFSLWLVLLKPDVEPSIYLSLAAGFGLVVGMMTDLNVVVHAALLIAALQFLRRDIACLLLLLAGIAWLPSFGYVMAMAGVCEANAAGLRVSLSLLAAAAIIMLLTTRKVAMHHG
jgi:hypothetical protein